MAWQVGIAANAVIALMYGGLAWMLIRNLRAEGSVWADSPGAWCVGLIFTTCSLGHAAHLTHLLSLPLLLDSSAETYAARASYDLHLAIVDVATAIVATLFWSLVASGRDQGAIASLLGGGANARRTALRVNHDVVQGLTLAGYQMDRGDLASARATMDATLEQARGIASAPFAHVELPTVRAPVGTPRDTARS